MRAKYAILGMGKSGKSVAQFLQSKGNNELLCLDKNEASLKEDPEIRLLLSKGAVLTSDDPSIILKDVKELILSPGVNWNHPLVTQAKSQKIPITGEAQFALQRLKHHKILGITGTNGKTTATMLTAHVLNQSGYSAVALGNVGTSLSSYLLTEKKEDVIVVELSSYQLEDLKGEILDEAVIINITPDHLNRYPNYRDYIEAKSFIQKAMKKKGKLFLSMQAKGELGDFLKMSYELFDLQKQYTWGETIQASFIMCKEFGISEEKFSSALSTFTMPAHRIEFVGEIKGIKFYNDSKATNVESTIHAVHSLKKNLLLIIGGQSKGLSYLEWNKVFPGKVKKVYMIGETADQMESELEIAKRKVSSLQEAIEIAYSEAKQGDAVVLSPGTASFDQFKNYQHRGEVFKETVQRIIEKEKIGSVSR